MIQRDHTFEENVFKFWEFLYLKNKQKIVYLNSLLFICKWFFFHRAEYMELSDKMYTNDDGQ